MPWGVSIEQLQKAREIESGFNLVEGDPIYVICQRYPEWAEEGSHGIPWHRVQARSHYRSSRMALVSDTRR